MNKPPAHPTPRLRARAWVEVGASVGITEAGADLLEQIEACGSLSAAARRLHYSYRRAWMLLDAMNRRWGTPVATTMIGGKRGGGATLTPFGRQLLSAYRDLQLQLEFVLDRQRAAFLKTLRAVAL